MKRLLFWVLAAVMFAACVEDVIDEQSIQPIVDDAPESLTVGFEENDTRVQLNEATKTVWTKDDLVSVFYRSNANQKWQYQGETGERVGNLKRVANATGTTKTTKTVVVYPYSENYWLNTDSYAIDANLPATQYYTEDSYGVGCNLMVSQSEFTQFSLKSVCGWLKLQLTGNEEVVKSIKLCGNNGEQVAGLIYVDTYTSESTLASEMGSSDDNNAGGNLIFDDSIHTEVTLDCGDGVTLGAEVTAFYIALPPQTFETGFTIEVKCEGYNPMTISTSNKVVIERNHIQPMAAVEHEAEKEQGPKKNEIWYTNGSTTEVTTPFYSDHFDANIIATRCHEGKGYVDFDGPITISDGQFYYEQDLVSIKLPNCITTIGQEAFYDCDCLESVELPETVTYIGTAAFAGCDNLTEINFPESLCEIGTAAFSRCKKLKSAALNEGLVTISERAFDYCEGLTGVHIPSSVKTVAPQAFAHCYNIDRFSGESTTEDWRCILIDGEIKAFAPASDARFYNIPDEVKSIGSYAFAYLDNIIHVNLGEGVEEIKDHAFYLSSLNNERGGISFKNVKIIGDYAFEETNLVYVSIPDCVTRIGKYAFKGCTMMREFDFGTGVTELEEGVFCWAGIQGFHIPKQITKIGDKAFKDCLIRWVGIPSTTTYIGTEAFQAPNLKTVYVSGKGPASAELGKNIFPEGVRIYVPFDYEALYRRLNNPWLQYDPKDWVPDDVENWDPEGPFGPYLGDY